MSLFNKEASGASMLVNAVKKNPENMGRAKAIIRDTVYRRLSAEAKPGSSLAEPSKRLKDALEARSTISRMKLESLQKTSSDIMVEQIMAANGMDKEATAAFAAARIAAKDPSKAKRVMGILDDAMKRRSEVAHTSPAAARRAEMTYQAGQNVRHTNMMNLINGGAAKFASLSDNS